MSRKIYNLRQSVDDEDIRPTNVTYFDPEGYFSSDEGWEVFQKQTRVAAGEPGHPAEWWFVPNLYAPSPGSTPITDWDYYSCNTFGAFSPRAIEVLRPYLTDRFDTLPAKLAGHDYLNLRCLKREDCLDRRSSRMLRADDTERTVLSIDKYVFRKKKVPQEPCIFAIPEMWLSLYCTESIPAIIEKAGLRGFRFKLVAELD